MAYEMAVALNVTNHELYQKYREGMTPLLTSYGGGFRYDFRISETLRSESDHPISRVFLIYFPNVESKEKFFNDPRYLKIREEFFDPAVGGRTLLAEYHR